MKKESNNSYAYISLVAIVAIVAMVILLGNHGPAANHLARETVYTNAPAANGNLGGQAMSTGIRSSNVNSNGANSPCKKRCDLEYNSCTDGCDSGDYSCYDQCSGTRMGCKNGCSSSSGGNSFSSSSGLSSSSSSNGAVMAQVCDCWSGDPLFNPSCTSSTSACMQCCVETTGDGGQLQ